LPFWPTPERFTAIQRRMLAGLRQRDAEDRAAGLRFMRAGLGTRGDLDAADLYESAGEDEGRYKALLRGYGGGG
jgi:hypothetical protein